MPSRKVIDQTGYKLKLPQEPSRIISLVPSQTELLAHLGLEKEVVGITTFCVHPEDWHQSKVRVGGTKKLNFTKIKDLNPDLIIANKEENNKDDIEYLRSIYPVWTSDVITMENNLEMIRDISSITNTETIGNNLTRTIRKQLDDLKPDSNSKVLYIIWNDPIMAVGSETYINTILELAGFINVLQDMLRYPELLQADLKLLNPDYVFLSSEPFPFSEKHISKFAKIFPNAEVKLVDGEMFSWYGSRTLKTIDYLKSLQI